MNNYFVFKPSNPSGGGVADPHLVASYHSPSVVANAAVMCPTNGGGLISSNPSTTHSSTSSLISSASSSRQSIGPFIDYAPNSYLNQNSAYLHPTQQLQQYDIFVTFNLLLLRFDFKNSILTFLKVMCSRLCHYSSRQTHHNSNNNRNRRVHSRPPNNTCRQPQP